MILRNKLLKIMFLPFVITSCSLGGDSTNNLTLFAGQQKSTKDGSFSEARFSNPYAVVADDADNIYVSEPTSHLIRKISSNGFVTTFAGQKSIWGAVNGDKQDATFTAPTGMVFDKKRKILYVLDSGNALIRKIDATGKVSNLSGQ